MTFPATIALLCCPPMNRLIHMASKYRGVPEYTAWCHMKARCDNTEHTQFKGYGGRGIGVCQRWRKFSNFLADMGPRPSPKHSLGRIDNDGHYTQKNCEWQTQKEQTNNMRSNRIIEHNGRKMTLAQWAGVLGVTYQTIQARIKRGTPIDDPISFRRPVMMTFQGVTMPQWNWSKAFGIPNSTLRLRLKNGSTLEQLAPPGFIAHA